MPLRPAVRAVLGAALLALAAPAGATPVNVTAQIPGDVFGGTASAKVRFKLEGDKPVDTLAGQFALEGDNGFGQFLAFCIDVENALAVGGNGAPYTPGPLPFGSHVSAALDRLFTSGYGRIDPQDGALAAGFQIAVWEVRYDSNAAFEFDIGKGAFKVQKASKDASAFAKSLLDGIRTASTGGYDVTFLASGLRSNGRQISQNLVTAAPAAIPLPAAAWMLGAGLIALALAGGFGRRSDPAAG